MGDCKQSLWSIFSKQLSRDLEGAEEGSGHSIWGNQINRYGPCSFRGIPVEMTSEAQTTQRGFSSEDSTSPGHIVPLSHTGSSSSRIVSPQFLGISRRRDFIPLFHGEGKELGKVSSLG